MPNDINELDVNDIGLKQMFGERFHDESEKPVMAEFKKTPTNPIPTAKAEQKPSEGSKTAQWEPRKERNWMDNLKDCAKSAAIYGSLNTLIFYWQQAGLMDSSIAVPSMCVVCCLMGLGIGKVLGGK